MTIHMSKKNKILRLSVADGDSVTKTEVPLGTNNVVRVHPEGLYDRMGVPVWYLIPKTIWEALLQTVWGNNDNLNIELRED